MPNTRYQEKVMNNISEVFSKANHADRDFVAVPSPDDDESVILYEYIKRNSSKSKTHIGTYDLSNHLSVYDIDPTYKDPNKMSDEDNEFEWLIVKFIAGALLLFLAIKDLKIFGNQASEILEKFADDVGVTAGRFIKSLLSGII